MTAPMKETSRSTILRFTGCPRPRLFRIGHPYRPPPGTPAGRDQSPDVAGPTTPARAPRGARAAAVSGLVAGRVQAGPHGADHALPHPLLDDAEERRVALELRPR